MVHVSVNQIPEPKPRLTEPDFLDPGAWESAFPSQHQPSPRPYFLGKSYYLGPYFPDFLNDKDYMMFLLKIQMPVPQDLQRLGAWETGRKDLVFQKT